MAPLTRGIGAIFMLHHVRPELPGSFEPNRILKVTPKFLEEVISQVRASGFQIVSLDEAHFRLIEGDYGKPFVCFTFDDGYRDNLEYAYPIFKRHNLPFAIYVPTDYADGHGDLWWLALEKVIVNVKALSREDRRRPAPAALRHGGREGCRLPDPLLVAQGHRRDRRARLRARPLQRCRLRSPHAMHRAHDDLGRRSGSWRRTHW